MIQQKLPLLGVAFLFAVIACSDEESASMNVPLEDLFAVDSASDDGSSSSAAENPTYSSQKNSSSSFEIQSSSGNRNSSSSFEARSSVNQSSSSWNDQSSSSVTESSSSHEKEMQRVHLGECSITMIPLNPSISFSQQAKVDQREDGSYELTLTSIYDNCDIMADVVYRVSNDTLFITYENIGTVADCMCTSDHFFTIDEQYVNVKYVEFMGIVLEVQKPGAQEEISSKLEHVRMGACLANPSDDKSVNQFLLLDGRGSGVILVEGSASMATFTKNGDSVELKLPAVSDYCEIDAEILYELSGDTLYVSYGELGPATKCLCNSDHYFTVDEKYTSARYVNFNNQVLKVKTELFASSDDVKMGECKSKSNSVPALNPTAKVKKEDGKYWVEIDDLNENCALIPPTCGEGDSGCPETLTYAYSGDTLTITNHMIPIANCLCDKDYSFVIPGEYTSAKYVRYKEQVFVTQKEL